MVGYIIIAVAVAGALLLLWPKLKALVSALLPSKATSAISTASDYATDAITAAAFQTLAVAGWVNNDVAFIAKLDECRQLQAKWNQPAPEPVQPTAADLAAKVAVLEAKLALMPVVVGSAVTEAKP